jgi:sulfite oxidase
MSYYFTRRRFLLTSTAAAAASCWLSARLTAAEDTDLIVRQADPLNAEPARPALAAEPLTPVKHFYVRSHGAIPKVDAAGFRLRIEGLVGKPIEFSLDELRQKFKSQSQEATLTCAGNRRLEMNQVKPVPGVQWRGGAIGHARWTGVSLAEVLRATELKDSAKHIWLDGFDPIAEKDGSVAPFGGSIPLDRALAAEAPPLLAFAMNDEPLTAAHGFPLRAVVPGYIGARSVKWLTKITASDQPSPNHYVAAAYKIVQVDDKDAQAAAEPIYANVVNAAICSPGEGEKLTAGRRQIQGYALPAGESGCTVAKVELSADGGKTWQTAQLHGEARPQAWQLWSSAVELVKGRQELIVRATDSRGNTMPKECQWNAKGYLFNAWHHVNVEVT